MRFHYSVVDGKVYLSPVYSKRGFDSDCVEISRRNSPTPVSPEDEELYSRVMKRSQSQKDQEEIYSRVRKRLMEDQEDRIMKRSMIVDPSKRSQMLEDPVESYSRMMKRSPEIWESRQTVARLCPDSVAGRGLDVNHQMSLFSLNW